MAFAILPAKLRAIGLQHPHLSHIGDLPDRHITALGHFQHSGKACGGLADRLDEMILDKSLIALTEWCRRGLNVPRVGVNFSAEQLRDPFMAEKIKWAVDAHDLDPSDVCIKILESVLVEEEGDDIAKNIASLSRTGFHIDLDDFGAGHASIATLQRFRVDRIKVDRSFVTAIDTDEEQ